MKDILISFAGNMRMHQPELEPQSVLSHAKEVAYNLMVSADIERKMNSKENTSNIVCSSDSEGETPSDTFNRRVVFEKVIEDYMGSTTNSFHKSIQRAFTNPDDNEKNPLKKLAKIYYRMDEDYSQKSRQMQNFNKLQEYQKELTSLNNR